MATDKFRTEGHELVQLEFDQEDCDEFHDLYMSYTYLNKAPQIYALTDHYEEASKFYSLFMLFYSFPNWLKRFAIWILGCTNERRLVKKLKPMRTKSFDEVAELG